MDDDLKEIAAEFLVESNEGLDAVEQDLLLLERSPEDVSPLTRVVRVVHSIKGGCGFLGFPKLEQLAHVTETSLVPVRDGKVRFDPEMADLLLVVVDRVRAALAVIAERDAEPPEGFEDLVAQVRALSEPKAAPPPVVDTASVPAAPTADDASSPPGSSGVSAASPDSEPSAPTEDDPTTKKTASRKTASKKTASKKTASRKTASKKTASKKTASKKTASKKTAPPPRLPPAAAPDVPVPLARTAPEATVVDVESRAHDTTIRVDVKLLDEMIALVGELVLARNQLLCADVRALGEQGSRALSRLNTVTTDLQERVMATRMRPVREVFSRVPRIARSVARASGKEVEVVMDGADTELDRGVLEALTDPLLHLIRNAVDHGIEDPEQRAASGKPRAGTLRLEAEHDGGFVSVRIIDDGKGIDTARVRAKALETGLLTEEAAAQLTEAEVTRLIFESGLSTAKAVTNISGRGVGMDVVRSNIERIDGVIDVASEPGRGTTFEIRLPLTLAITTALVVRDGGQRYVIPQLSVLELIRLGSDVGRLERLGDGYVYWLRDQLIPLVWLRRWLSVNDEPLRFGERGTVVLLAVGAKVVGLVVDEVLASEEIVVKPISWLMRHIDAYSGTTVLGDGSVALILHASSLVDRYGVEVSMRRPSLAPSAALPQPEMEDGRSLLVCRDGRGAMIAVRVSEVTRIEEMAGGAFETTHGVPVVQYRGALLPLVFHHRPAADELVQVLVREHDAEPIGVVVSEVVELVPGPTDAAARSFLHDDAVIDIVSMRSLIGSNRPTLLLESSHAA